MLRIWRLEGMAHEKVLDLSTSTFGVENEGTETRVLIFVCYTLLLSLLSRGSSEV